jgi:hypothetical protein
MPWPELPPLDVPGSGPLGLGLSDEWDALVETGPEFLAKVRRHFNDLYCEDEATRLFLETTPKKKRGEHGRWQNLLRSRDVFLLREYDQARRGLPPKSVKKLPRMFGVIFDRAAPGKLGATATAIEHHIRELVRERAAKRAQERARGTLRSQYGE